MPTELDGVVVVSGLEQDADANPRLYYRSNRGIGVVDVTAPGAGVYSAGPTGYGYYSGTSFAAPLVSGVVALLKSRRPTASPAQLVRLLEKQADPLPCPTLWSTMGAVCVGEPGANSYFGRGIPDALDAVTR